MPEEIQVKVGQVWRDNDPRMNSRLVKILEIKDGKAVCRHPSGGRLTKIRLDRFRKTSTGYVLHEEAKSDA